MDSDSIVNTFHTKTLDFLETINVLAKRYQQEWITLRKIAKEMEGSEAYEPVISGYADIAKEKGWIAISSNQKLVMLMEAGRKILLTTPSENLEIGETQKIANAVKKYAARLDRQILRVEQVMTVARASGKFVQALLINLDENNILPETPVEFCPQDGSSRTTGRIVAQDEDGGVIYVAFDSEVLNIHLPAVLSIDRAFLLNQLANSLENLDTYPILAEPIFTQNIKGFPFAKENSADIADMLAYLGTPWTRFLWGPPGAGKSYALGRLIVQLLKNKPSERILIVAPSNLAVDVTTSQLIERLEEYSLGHLIEQRKILRYGYPKRVDILERSEILGTQQQDELTKLVKDLSSQIVSAERRNASDEEIAILRTELFAAQEVLKRLVNEHVSRCNVVATTTTLAYMPSSPISKQKWDTVLVDEVTMVPPAQCVFISSIGKSRLLLAGDPRQLGPVYEESNRATKADYEWMGRDIFDKAGISTGQGITRSISISDIRLARITSQRRCENNIWDQVSFLYPEVSNLANQATGEYLCSLPPKSGESTVLMDVGDFTNVATCEQVHESWRNPYTASLALEIASVIAAEAKDSVTIAIISPYRAQTKLLQSWLRTEKRADNPFAHNIETGTIHQFQGSEADIVLFDIVDGVGRNRLGKLLKGDIGLRLANVAFTRARGKLIVIANKSWCQTRMNRAENPLLWDFVVGSSPSQLMPVLPPPSLDSNDELFMKTESPIERELLTAVLKIPELREIQAQYMIRDPKGEIITRADFAFPSLKYAVYCDGAQWHLPHDRWQKDLRQRNRLAELGWAFSVYSGKNIKSNADECAQQIKNTIIQRQSSY